MDTQHSSRIYSKNPKTMIVFGVLIIIISIICGIALFFSHINPLNNDGYVETIGIIVDDYFEYDELNDIEMYRPIAEFEVDGEIFEVVSDSSSSVPSFLGSTVTILYNPQNPTDAFFKTSNISFVFFISIILVSFVCGIVVLINGIKHSRENRI